MRKTFCSIKVLLITTLALFVIFVAIVLLAFFGVPVLVNSELEQTVRLEKDTVQWDRFVEIPFPLDFKTWLFNVTNPDEILKGETPILKEVGPYYYKEGIKKNILFLNSAEDTVSYDRTLTFTFDEELSAPLTEDDELVVLNPVMLSISQVTTTIERMALGGCLHKIFPDEYNGLFIKVKVRTLLFDGFEFGEKGDDIGVACNIVRNKILEKTDRIRNIAKTYSGDDVSSLRFSYYNYKIADPDGIYSIVRGIRDISHLGHIRDWNNTQQLSNWGRSMSINNDTCSRVRGTDATIYPPGITKDSNIEIFSTDVCRVIGLTYSGKSTYKGVDGLHFTTNENTFRPATQYSENDCFCVQQTLDEEGLPSCYLDGILDLQPCTGAPILLSFPHFLYADEKYLQAIKGVDEADESIHKIYLLVEPNTGTPLEGKKRVQFNVVLRPVRFLSFSQNLPKAVIPLFWVEEGVSLPQKYIDELNDEYFNKLKIIDGIKYALIAVGLAAVVTSSGFLIRKKFFTGK